MPHKKSYMSWHLSPPIPERGKTLPIYSALFGDHNKWQANCFHQAVTEGWGTLRCKLSPEVGPVPRAMFRMPLGRHWWKDSADFVPPPSFIFQCWGVRPLAALAGKICHTVCNVDGGWCPWWGWWYRTWHGNAWNESGGWIDWWPYLGIPLPVSLSCLPYERGTKDTPLV